MSIETLKYVQFEVNKEVAIATLNRPEKLNALNLDVFLEIESILDNCDADPDIKVLVITGSDRAFAAGADIGDMVDADSAKVAEITKVVMRVQKKMESCVPVIASVSGLALGGGCELALACDIRIASDSAAFGLPEIKLGIIPGGGGTQRLARISSPATALHLALTGEPISADQAISLGIVSRVVPQEQLKQETLKLAEKLKFMPPLAVKAVKKAIYEGSNLPLDDGLNMERTLFSSLFETSDQTEGMKAFIEKRVPVFKGI